MQTYKHTVRTDWHTDAFRKEFGLNCVAAEVKNHNSHILGLTPFLKEP